MGPILVCTATGLLATLLFPLRYRISDIFKRFQLKIPDSQPTELRKFNWHWRPNTGLHIVMRRVHDPRETIPAVASPRGYTDEQLLEHLRKLLSSNGKLSAELIKSCPDAPPLPLYRARFGGLSKAYRLIGYRSARRPPPRKRARTLSSIRTSFVKTVTEELQSLGASVRQDARTQILVVNNNLKIRLSVATCRVRKRSRDWILYVQSPSKPDFTLIARLAPENKNILDYLFLPSREQGPSQVTVGQVIRGSLHNYHHTDLAFLKDIAGGSKLALSAFR